MDQTKAIDFEKLKQEELAKAAKAFIFKQVSREDLFNNLQDLRHLLIFDLRPKADFHNWHVRDSFCVEDAKGDQQILLHYLEETDKKVKETEEKYKMKPIRRAFFVDTQQNTYNENDEKTKFVLDALKKYGGFDKVFYLKQGIEHFSAKYPFLCLNFNERDQESQTNNQNTKVEEKKEGEQPILSPYQTKLFYSFSRFPTEILEGKLFLGSIYNANNKRQMEDLGIKSIIEFVDYKDKPIPQYKTEHYNYKNIPIEGDSAAFVDYDEICTYIDELLGDQTKSPVLICCKDGDTISPVIAIAYQVWHKKSNLTIASAVIYQKRGTVDANKALYTVLTTWQPQGQGDQKRKNQIGIFGR